MQKAFLRFFSLILAGSLYGCHSRESTPSLQDSGTYDLISPAPIFANEEVIIIQDPDMGWDSHRHYKRHRRHHP